ncbi:MAG: hypothetical protein EPN84_01025, partial [Legionella sp.]
GKWCLKERQFIDTPIASITYTNKKNIFPTSSADMQGSVVVLPGLYDSHIHGAGGHDFSEGTTTAYIQITETLGKNGVAYCAATFVSMEWKRLISALETLDDFLIAPQVAGAAKIVAVHLEGPFIAKSCKGAHDEQVLQNEISLSRFLELVAAAPGVRNWKITLAPDLPGALEFIEQTRNLQVKEVPIAVHVFIGHSNANYATVQQAVDRGIAGFTHLGNANGETVHRKKDCRSFLKAESDVVRFALDHSIPAEVIADGLHLSNEFVAFVQSHTPVMLVSDALSPTMMPDGEYELASLKVLKQEKRIVLKDQQEKLAGGSSLLPDLLVNFNKIVAQSCKSNEERLNALYQAVIVNPRQSSLRNAELDDENNFVILDKSTGELLFSCCHGIVIQHRALTVPEKKIGFLAQSGAENAIESENSLCMKVG